MTLAGCQCIRLHGEEGGEEGGKGGEGRKRGGEEEGRGGRGEGRRRIKERRIERGEHKTNGVHNKAAYFVNFSNASATCPEMVY